MTEPQPIQLKFSCGENWDAMTPVAGGRHCHACHKTVHDFTDSKPDEFRRILAEHGYNICGRFNAEDVAVNNPILPFWRRWTSAALLLLGLDLWSCNDAPTERVIEVVNQPFKLAENHTLGTPLPPPVHARFHFSIPFVADSPAEFSGGMQAFNLYINKHLCLKHQFSREVRARFIVERNGRIHEVEITKGGDDVINKEIIRVIRRSPKWKPARANGRKVSQEVIVPVVIN